MQPYSVCGLFSLFVRLYCLSVQLSRSPALSLCRPLQRVLRGHSGTSTDDAGHLDYHGVSALRRTAVLSADRHISWQTFVQANNETEEVRDAPIGEMKRAQAWEEQQRRKQDRFVSTLVIAASIIAAVRLARESDITHPSPRIQSVIGASIQLARMILTAVIR